MVVLNSHENKNNQHQVIENRSNLDSFLASRFLKGRAGALP